MSWSECCGCAMAFYAALLILLQVYLSQHTDQKVFMHGIYNINILCAFVYIYIMVQNTYLIIILHIGYEIIIQSS